MSSNVCNGHFVYVEKDGVIDKTNVRCNYCSATFKYHHSLSSLKYHLQAKHPSMGFTMPNRQTIKNRVDAMFDAQKAVVQTKLNSALCVALTADYWTSVTNDSYLGIVSHFIDDSKLLAYTLAVQYSTERHFAHNIVLKNLSLWLDNGIYTKK
jgi:hypothetical protein